MKINYLKFWHNFFLTLGVLAIIDKVTGVAFYDNSFGAISHFLILLFGASVAEIAVIASDFALIWLGVAYLLYRKSKVKENPSKENKKHYKIAKIVALIVGGLFLAGVIMAFFLIQRTPVSESPEIKQQESTIPRMPQPIGSTVKEVAESWNANQSIFRREAEELGFSDDEINAEIERAFEEWRPELERLKEAENQNEMCNHSKKWVLNEAFEHGITDVDVLEEISKTYDLLCEE